MRMSKFFLSLTLLASITQICSTAAYAKTDIEFILDASGSMRAAMEGKTQMDVAKQSVKAALESIPPETNVAFRAYAHRVEQSDKAQSCLDTELLIPFGPLDKISFAARLDSLQPKGYTPIAYSLEQVEKDFGIERESDKVIILVSDGEETCGGDPIQTVKNLIAKGYKITLNAVGFNADPAAQAQLKALAQAGGGQYYDAKDSNSLSSALRDISQKALLTNKTQAVYGTEVQGGDSYETATPLPIGKEVHLNHHQRVNQFDYFFIDLKAGQQISVTMNTLLKGISVQGNEYRESTNPYAGFQIHNALRSKIGGKELIGAANITVSDLADADVDGRYYVLIGSQYDNMHKDHPFKVELKSFFDAGTDHDAGSTPDKSIPIEKKEYPENYASLKDEGDFYKVSTQTGETLTLTVIPENSKASLMGQVFDDLKVELAGARSQNPGAGFKIPITATGTTTYIKISLLYQDAPTKYSFKVEGSSVAPTAPAATPPALTPPTTGVPTTTPTIPTTPTTEITPPRIPPNTGTLTPKASQNTENEPVAFDWKEPEALRILAIVFGAGAFVGLVFGMILRGLFIRKPKVVTAAPQPAPTPEEKKD